MYKPEAWPLSGSCSGHSGLFSWGILIDIFIIFGCVPVFCLLHIPLFHILSLFVHFLREGNFHGDWYGYAPFTKIFGEHRWGLLLLYLVFVTGVAAPCFIGPAYAKY